jgi:RNA polymerase sigma-70 factor, ECF subfamily
MPTGEQTLIEKAKTDAEAFGILYDRYVEKIYNYIYFRVGNHHDAEDLTARTFHRALNHIGNYQHKGAPFSAWLYRIAHNLMANWHRDRQRHPVVSIEDMVISVQSELEPPLIAEALEEKHLLLETIRGLPPERQQLLTLKFVEGLSNIEIGKIMGRSEGAIKSLYFRTLVSLRQMLESEEAE